MGDSKAASSSSREPTSSKKKVVQNRAPRASARRRSRTRSPSASPPPAPHLLRRGHTGLMSPPPSRRAPVVVPRLATPPPPEQLSESSSRDANKGETTVLPKFDSPNNPFIDSPGSVPASEDLSSPEPRTPQKHAEKPMLTYVLYVSFPLWSHCFLHTQSRCSRGVKLTTANPHYVGEEAAAEREARAQLPIEHPDYSPSDACVPTLLFPTARKRDLARRRAHPVVPVPTSPTPTTSRRRTGSHSSDEGHTVPIAAPVPAAPGPSVGEKEDDFDAMAAAMAARVARHLRKGVLQEGEEAPHTRPSSRMRELPQLPEKDRSDPIKRALGPVRRGP